MISQEILKFQCCFQRASALVMSAVSSMEKVLSACSYSFSTNSCSYIYLSTYINLSKYMPGFYHQNKGDSQDKAHMHTLIHKYYLCSFFYYMNIIIIIIISSSDCRFLLPYLSYILQICESWESLTELLILKVSLSLVFMNIA